MFAKESRGSARRAPKPPKPQRIARRVTIHAKPAPRHHAPKHHAAPVHHYNPPPVHHTYHAPKQTYHAPARRHTYNPPPQHRRGGGGGGGGGGRSHAPAPRHQGRVQSVGRQAKAPKPAPKPKIPGVSQFLNSDAAYRTGTSELMRALQQFNVSNQGSRADVRDAFKTAMERMGDERTKSLQSLQEDFASRGLLTSGLYSDAVSDYNTEFGKRSEDLNKDRGNQLENLREESTNFAGLNKSKQADLRLDAIRRRAEKYGIRA